MRLETVITRSFGTIHLIRNGRVAIVRRKQSDAGSEPDVKAAMDDRYQPMGLRALGGWRPSWQHCAGGKEMAMGSRRAARLACAAVAGLALAGAGLSGSASPAWAGVSLTGSASGATISTVAGGVGGPGRATSVGISPCGVHWAGGSLYIGDGSTVREVSTATDALTTVAGDNAAGPTDNSGAATSSALSQACGTTIDTAGNLVIAAGLQVRVVAARTGTFYGQAMTGRHIYTVAGTAAASREGGPAGDGGSATSAALSDAVDVAFDQAGNLLITDSGQALTCGEEAPLGSLVRVMAARTGTFYGQKMTAGDIYSVAGVQSVGPAGDGGLATRAWLGPDNRVGPAGPGREPSPGRRRRERLLRRAR